MNYYVESDNSSMLRYRTEFFMQKNSKRTAAKSHMHPAIEFLYIISGSYEVTSDDKTALSEAGDLCFFPSNSVHSVTSLSERGGEYWVLKLHPSFLFEIFNGEYRNLTLSFLRDISGGRIVFKAQELTGEILSAIQRLIYDAENKKEYFPISVRINGASLCLELSRTLLKSKTEEDGGLFSVETVNRIYHALCYIDENFSQDIPVLQVADYVHMSYSYFARLFKAITGKTFKEYLRSVRMEHAEYLLTATKMSVTETALAAGYSSLAYFIAEYKQTYGTTPGKSLRKPKGKIKL